MSDVSFADWISEPEKTEVPVRGDCGHVFTVPLTRLQDQAEFNCPVCGQVDRFDDQSVRQAQEALAEKAKGEPDGGVATRLSVFLKSCLPGPEQE